MQKLLKRGVLYSIVLLILLNIVLATDISFTSPDENTKFNLGEDVFINGYVSSDKVIDGEVELYVNEEQLDKKPFSFKKDSLTSFKEIFGSSLDYVTTKTGDFYITFSITENEEEILSKKSPLFTVTDELSIVITLPNRALMLGEEVPFSGIVSNLRGPVASDITVTLGEKTKQLNTTTGSFSSTFIVEQGLENIEFNAQDSRSNKGNFEVSLNVSPELEINLDLSEIYGLDEKVPMEPVVKNIRGDIIENAKIKVLVTGPEQKEITVLPGEEIKFTQEGTYTLTIIAETAQSSGKIIKKIFVGRVPKKLTINIPEKVDVTKKLNYSVLLKDNFGRIIEDYPVVIEFFGPEETVTRELRTNNQGVATELLDISSFAAGQWRIVATGKLYTSSGFVAKLKQFFIGISAIQESKDFEVMPHPFMDVEILDTQVEGNVLRVRGVVENTGNLNLKNQSLILKCDKCVEEVKIQNFDLLMGQAEEFFFDYTIQEKEEDITARNLHTLYTVEIPNLGEKFKRGLGSAAANLGILLLLPFLLKLIMLNFANFYTEYLEEYVEKVEWLAKIEHKIVQKIPITSEIVLVIFAGLIFATFYKLSGETMSFWLVALAALLSVVLHDFAHFYIHKKQKIPVQLHFWFFGTILLAISSYFFKFPFGTPYRDMLDEGDKKTSLLGFTIGPFVSLLVCAISLSLYYLNVFPVFFLFLASLNAMMALYHMMPIKPLDGYYIIKKAGLWFLMFAPIIVLYFWIEFWLPIAGFFG